MLLGRTCLRVSITSLVLLKEIDVLEKGRRLQLLLLLLLWQLGLLCALIILYA
jgi:hypothetical protein